MPWGLKRYYGTGALHFITWSCYHRSPLLGWRARDLFLTVLELMRERYRFGVVGYVVMPEHVHLLISEPQIGDPSTVVQAASLIDLHDSIPSEGVTAITAPFPLLQIQQQAALHGFRPSGAEARVVCGVDGTAKAVPFHKTCPFDKSLPIHWITRADGTFPDVLQGSRPLFRWGPDLDRIPIVQHPH